MSNNENNGLVAEVATLVLKGTVRGEAQHPFVVIPNDHRVHSLEELQQYPRRVREQISHATVDSFIAYLNTWKTIDSVIFCSEEQRSLRAVIDYHADHQNPTWCEHTASYSAKLSREATAWISKNGKGFSQIEFAEFLEERAEDVVNPRGADLLELALKLQVIQKASFGSAIKLSTGEFQMKWSEENQQGTVELPEKITLGIPLFHNGPGYKLDARLRYRVKDGQVTFIYKLVDHEVALEQAFTELVAKVKANVADVEIYQGSRAK